MRRSTSPRRSSGRLSGRALAGVECADFIKAYLSSSTLKHGDRGLHVQSLQADLKAWGLYSGALDGQYGPATAQAVRRFQGQRGIGVDGVMGPATQRELCAYLGEHGDPQMPGSGEGEDRRNGGGSGSTDRYLIYGTAAAAGVGLAILFARKRQ